jgi:hypothetical protein
MGNILSSSNSLSSSEFSHISDLSKYYAQYPLFGGDPE